MRKYAEVHRGRVIAHIIRNDDLTPEFVDRIAVEITGMNPEPQPGWRYDGSFTLDVVPPIIPVVDRLEEMDKKLDRIINLLTPLGGPP